MAQGHANANTAFAQLSAAIQQQVLATNAQVAALQANTKQAQTAAQVLKATQTAQVKLAGINATVNLALNKTFSQLAPKVQQAALANIQGIVGGGGPGGAGGAGGWENAWKAQIHAVASGSPLALLSSFGPMGAAAAAATGTLTALAASASPNAMATFTGSLELVSAKMGRELVPVLENFSRGLQGISNLIDKLPGAGKSEAPKGLWSEVGSSLKKSFLDFVIPLRLASEVFGLIGDAGGVAKGTEARSEKGLPQPAYSSFSDYIDRLDVAGLKSNTTEGLLLQEQLSNTKGINTNTQATADLLRSMNDYFRANPVAFRN
jgi:hypothetical protein